MGADRRLHAAMNVRYLEIADQSWTRTSDVGRKPPQQYAGENVRFDISIAQSSRSDVGPTKSRLLGALVGRSTGSPHNVKRRSVGRSYDWSRVIEWHARQLMSTLSLVWKRCASRFC